jgi:hypothetical protein
MINGSLLTPEETHPSAGSHRGADGVRKAL